MASKSELKISPNLFRWARESAGVPLVLAAKRIGIKPDRLEEWEGKEALPTPRQLEKAADTYKRPVACFFLPAPPDEPPLPVDFRAATTAHRDLSTTTRFAIRRARWLKEVYAELTESKRTTLPDITDTRPELVAEAIRGWLEPTLKAVRGKQPNDALRIWRDSLEHVGLLVFQFSLPVDDTHAFSLADGTPTIVLNSRDVYARRIFSTVHELAHLLLRQPGLCNPSEYVQVEGSVEIEVRCNAIAGLTLVPTASLTEQPPVARLRRGGDVMEILVSLARTFAVSRQVIISRLFQLDMINRATFHRTMDALQLEYQELQKLKKKRRIVVQPSVKAIGQLGTKFVTDVLAAHDRGAIGDSEVAEYLGVRLQHIDKIQELVGAE